MILSRTNNQKHSAAFVSAWLLALLYVALAATSARHVNIQRDEFTDFQIGYAFLSNPSMDSGIDGSQARLPMYLSAVTWKVAHSAGLTKLPPLEGIVWFGRWLAVLASAGAIVLTHTLGRRWFGTATGLLAAALLAVSPYFLTFGRYAMTEGDAFGAPTVLLSLWMLDRFTRHRTLRHALPLACAIGLAAASKFYLGYLVLAFAAWDILGRHERQPVPWRAVICVAIITVLTLTGIAATMYKRVHDLPLVQDKFYWTAVACWAGVWAGLVVAAFVFHARTRVSPIVAWLLIAPLALAVCLAVCPAHMVNPKVIGLVFKRAGGWDGEAPGSDLPIVLRLYAGVLLLKLGLPLGIATVAALPWALGRAVRDRAMRLVVIVTGLFLLLLAVMPYQQTFYLMSVYPLLVLMLSAFVVHVAASLKSQATKLAWIGVTAAACGWLLVGVVRAYPTFEYYGYETVGDRWWGAESRGYHEVVYFSTDGSMDAWEWCRRNVRPGAVVVNLPYDRLLLAHLEREKPFPFTFVKIGRHEPYDRATLEHCDYLIVHLLNRVTHHNAPPEVWMEDLFEHQPVHTVFRGRGVYRTAVVEIYRRRTDL